jgi:hypothetical protein
MANQKPFDLDAALKELQTRDLDELTRKAIATRTAYRIAPEIIRSVAQLTGTSEENVLRSCVQVGHNYEHVTWIEILSLVRSFHITKMNLEEEETHG